MENNYINLMIDSLNKKNAVLDALLTKTEQQKDLVSVEETDWDAFDRTVDEKGDLISEITKLDEGFDALFSRVKEEIDANGNLYKDKIAEMQKLIKEITDKSAKLSAEELRNKNLIEKKFREERNNIKQSKMGTKAALNYYQKMNKINVVDPQLMDKKS